MFLDEEPLVSVDGFSPSGNCVGKKVSEKTVTWCTWSNEFKMTVGQLYFPVFILSSLCMRNLLFMPDACNVGMRYTKLLVHGVPVKPLYGCLDFAFSKTWKE